MFSNPFLTFIAWLYQCLIKITSNLQSIFLLVMRVTWGYQFFIAGYGKLAYPDKVAYFFAGLGIPAPLFNAYLIGTIESIGGILLIIGLASRLACIPLIAVMLTAYSTAHAHIFHDFAFIFNPSLMVREQPYPYLLTSLLVIIFGPGRVSCDAWIKRKLERGY